MENLLGFEGDYRCACSRFLSKSSARPCNWGLSALAAWYFFALLRRLFGLMFCAETVQSPKITKDRESRCTRILIRWLPNLFGTAE